MQAERSGDVSVPAFRTHEYDAISVSHYTSLKEFDCTMVDGIRNRHAPMDEGPRGEFLPRGGRGRATAGPRLRKSRGNGTYGERCAGMQT